jgi:hypothetical protein
MSSKRKQPKRFRVRFHLGKGNNYQKWQITDMGNTLYREYYDPSIVEIVMYKARLGNQASTARKIYNGANKTVCAWVDCDMVDIVHVKSPHYQPTNTEELTRFKYNPRKNPHWFTDEDPNVDGQEFLKMTTKNRSIYA